MGAKWIKITTDIFDDEKIQMIEAMPKGDTLIVIWFKLLCLAGKQNNDGVFRLGDMPYTDEMFATIFRKNKKIVSFALKIFENFGMIETINSTKIIPNWEKHQAIELLDKMRAQNRERVAKHRERQKSMSVPKADYNAECNEKCNITSNANVMPCNAIEKEIDIYKEYILKEKEKSVKKEKKTASRFLAPTLEEIQAYCDERNNGIDAERFLDYYTANGWVQGNGKPIKDWKATVRTWERADMPKQPIRQELNDYAELG